MTTPRRFKIVFYVIDVTDADDVFIVGERMQTILEHPANADPRWVCEATRASANRVRKAIVHLIDHYQADDLYTMTGKKWVRE